MHASRNGQARLARRRCILNPIVLFAVVLFAAAAPPSPQAQPCPPECFDNGWSVYSYWEMDQPGVAIVCPKGDGTLSAAIEIWILNNCQEPLCTITAAEDIQIFWNGGTSDCSLDTPEETIKSWETTANDSWHADYATDALTGKTYLSTSQMCGSGFSGSPLLGVHHLMVQRSSTVFPQPLDAGSCLPIAVRSPDLDLDGDVGVSDFAIFGTYNNSSCGSLIGDYMCHRCDLNADGAVSATDFAIFGAHYNHSCQDCPRSVIAACN